MRTLKLSHRDIELIEQALNHMFKVSLKITADRGDLLSKEEVTSIINRGNEYNDLRMEISDSKKDV